MKKLSGIIVTIAICIIMAFAGNSPALAAETEGTTVTEEGFVYEKDGNQVTVTGYQGTGTELVIPATIDGCRVTGIGDGTGAFAGSSLTSIKLPAGVTNIGDYAFNGCSNLTRIELPAGVSYIGECAFAGCGALKSIDLPESMWYIGPDAFDECQMESVYIRSKSCSFGDDKLFKMGAVIYGYGGSIIWNNYIKDNKDIVFKCIGEHEYDTKIAPASILRKSDGKITHTCEYCGSAGPSESIPYPKTVKLSADSYTYDGKAKTPGVTIIGSDGKMIPSKYYKVTPPASSVNAGTYEMKITFTGVSEYYSSGTFYPTFTIKKATQKISGVKNSYTQNYSKKGSMTLKASAKGNVKVTYTSSNTDVAKVNRTTGKVTFVGTGTTKITMKAAATDNYTSASKKITIKVKMPQKITIKGKSAKSYKYSKLKTKGQAFQISASASANGKLTYKVSQYPKNARKYISVSTKGKVTLKKGAKKGTYKITVTAAETTKYNTVSKVVTIKVK